MKHLSWFAGAVALSLMGTGGGQAKLGQRGEIHRVNDCLHGQVLDFTHNHGSDRRIWSDALHEKRDLYVYVPPGYDPQQRYPLGIYLHGATQDEVFFLKVVKHFDQAIAEGKLPPCILAAPDGSIQGRASYFYTASFFANTRAGNFEDFLMIDVWNFVMENFPIRPEREAHALLGVSMGGSAAFSHAIKYKDRVKVAIGFAPALNLRWVDCHGRYAGKFDPDCWGWREKTRPMEIIGRPDELVKIRFHVLFEPILGKGPQAIAELSRINPVEIMDRCDLKDGELDLYVGYGGKDEFNIAAQVESFLHRAHARGVKVGVGYDPEGKHDYESGVRLLPDALRWAAPLMEPYRPAPDRPLLEKD